MYSTCLFCHAPLGRNEVVENFPVGGRLAFDAARGRLWVVCRICERWCLSPLEERWEAIEECERLFRGTHLRISTDQIGLARVPEGLELVRIGEPTRPEMAAWRYGDQFGRRRRHSIMQVGLALSGIGAAVAGSFSLGIGGVIAGIYALQFLYVLGPDLVRRIIHGPAMQLITPVPGPNGRLWQVRREDLSSARLRPAETASGWELELFLNYRTFSFRDAEALRLAAHLLPAINRYGGNALQVRSAVEFLDRADSQVQVFTNAARLPTSGGSRHLLKLPYPVRLALEMAAHEDQERRVLEGELAQLEREWREAEEIASIADRLTVASAVEKRLERMRSSRDRPGA